MIETHVECTVDASIDEVFARLVDLPGWSEWLDDECGTAGCRYTSDGPVGAGTTYEDQMKMGAVIPGRIDEFESPSRIVFLNRVVSDSGEPAFESRLEYSLRSLSPTSTLVVHDFRAEFFGEMAAMEEGFRDGMPQERARISESLTRSFASAG